MATKTRHVVTATMIVAKVPGAQGGETYLRRDQLLPQSVTAAEIERLTELGLIAEYDALDFDAIAAEAAEAERLAAEAKAEEERLAAEAKAEEERKAAAAATPGQKPGTPAPGTKPAGK